MDIGVVFPQVEIGSDPARIRDYAQAVEGMGYTHVLALTMSSARTPSGPAAGRARIRIVTRSTSRSCCSASSPA